MEWFEQLNAAFNKIFTENNIRIVHRSDMNSALIGRKIPNSNNESVIAVFQYRKPDKWAIGIDEKNNDKEQLFFVHHENGESGRLVKVIDSIHMEKCLLLVKMRVDIKEVNKTVLNYHKSDFKRDSRIDEMFFE